MLMRRTIALAAVAISILAGGCAAKRQAATSPVPTATSNKSYTVYITGEASDAVYHLAGCTKLNATPQMVDLVRVHDTMQPCPICHPPTYDALAADDRSGSGSSGGSGGSVSSGGSSSSGAPKTVHVKGYTRKDGTYVKPHTRSRPKPRH